MRTLWALLALTTLCIGAQAQWTETGDAGDLPETAQATGTDTNTALPTISGALAADDVDMFAIYIADPASFQAETNATTTNFDSQLWLFDVNGNGIVHDDDSAGGLRSRITNANNCIPGPGTYYIAISRYNRDAVDASNQRLWNDTPLRALRCADGPGAANAIAGWTGSATAGGRYIISLQGAYFVSEQGCQTTQCEGDATGDGRVDDADLLEVLFNFGCFGFCGSADVDNNGTVDDADLLIVLFNFGCGS